MGRRKFKFIFFNGQTWLNLLWMIAIFGYVTKSKKQKHKTQVWVQVFFFFLCATSQEGPPPNFVLSNVTRQEWSTQCQLQGIMDFGYGICLDNLKS
jgi:hypothetical protein